MLLVFAHLLAASTALGAIVATDLRLLAKFSQDKVRIAPPNEFVTRIVMLALLMLYVTGGAIVWHGLGQRADYLENPKLQAKILLVVVLTINAFILHKVTFPRLARGRRVVRWNAADWVVVAVPVAVSNFLWMFTAFLGIARPWNFAIPASEIFAIAAALYVVTQCGVVVILATAGRKVEPGQFRWADRLAHSLAALGNLGKTHGAPAKSAKRASRRRSSAHSIPDSASLPEDASLPDDASLPPIDVRMPDDVPVAGLPAERPALRLVADRARRTGR